MLLSLMKNSILYTLYGLNQEVFITLFCANQSRPDLHCDGKCELSKMFVEKQKESATRILVQLQLENQYFSPEFSFNFPDTRVFSAPGSSPGTLQPDTYSFNFFHKNRKPPQAA